MNVKNRKKECLTQKKKNLAQKTPNCIRVPPAEEVLSVRRAGDVGYFKKNP
jgi:hypothetical protein